MKLENWLVIEHTTCQSLKGDVYGNPRFEDGTRVRTSVIKGKRNGAIVTQNSVYELGIQQEDLSLFPEHEKQTFLKSLKEV